MTHRVKTESPRFTQGGLRLLLTVVSAGCAAIVITLPTPVLPGDPPSLVTRSWELRASTARLRASAETVPTDPDAAALERAFLDAGRLESGAIPRSDLTMERIATSARRARAGLDVSAITALRARAVLRFESILDRRGVPAIDSDDPAIGGFGSALVRWGAVRDGVLLAPRLVVRTMYAARFNAIVGLPATSGFGRSELRAYHGWLALHAPDVDRGLRLQAIAAYRDAGGGDAAEEAQALALYHDGSGIPSAHAYERLHDRTGSVRLRNLALGASIPVH